MREIGFFKKDYIIGLDIGRSSIKLVQLSLESEHPHIVKVGLEEIAGTDNKVFREKETLTALKRLLNGIDIKRSKFIIGINCPKTSIRRILVPFMPKAELREGIKLEAKNYFPFSITGAFLDYMITKEVTDKGIKKYELLIATSPYETVNSSLLLLGKAGIKPTSFVPTCFALQRFVNSSLVKEGPARCFIDIGNSETELIIFKGKDLVFSRSIPIAGNGFTNAMTSVLTSERGKIQLSFDEAEKIKREIGIPKEGDSVLIDNKISSSQILSMLRSPLQQFASEIDRCFDYYREESRGESVESVSISGRSASLKGLPAFLSEELGIEVKLAVELQGTRIEPEAKAYDERPFDYSVATGAALSKGEGINLLPLEIKEETQRAFKRATITSLAISALLIAGFFYVGMKIQLTNFYKRIPVARMELSSLGPQLREAEMQHLANLALAGEPYWDDVFKELCNIIPEDMYITELQMKQGSIRIKGVVASIEKEKLLSDFIFALEKGIMRGVRLVTSKELKGKDANKFELKFWVD